MSSYDEDDDGLIMSATDTAQFSFPGHIGAYDQLVCIGTGASSTVYKAVCTANGQSVAIKAVALRDSAELLQVVRTEVGAMANYKHSNVVGCHNAFLDERTESLMVVMPFICCGSVTDILRTTDKFRAGIKEEAMLAAIVRQMMKGLQVRGMNAVMANEG